MTDDQSIVQLAVKDPTNGFKRLMDKYKGAVYWHVRRMVVTHEDAQDATQETFIRIYRSLSQYKQETSLRSWIYCIATNEALRLIGKRRNHEVSMDDTLMELNAMTADEYVDFTDVEAVKLQQAILSLPAKQQLAFNLRYYDELEYDEIAAITGGSAASAKQNYHIAKEKIIKQMQTIQ